MLIPHSYSTIYYVRLHILLFMFAFASTVTVRVSLSPNTRGILLPQISI